MASRTFKNSNRYQSGDSISVRLSGIARTLSDKTGYVMTYYLQKPIASGVSVSITANLSSSVKDNCYSAKSAVNVQPMWQNGGAVFTVSSIGETQMSISVRNANGVEVLEANNVYLVEIPSCTISFT